MFGYSVKDILFQVGIGMLSSVITGALASLFNTNPAAIFIWCLCAFGAGLVISNQLLIHRSLKADTSSSKPVIASPSPLRINLPDAVAIQFDDVIGQRYYTWEMENESGQEVSVQRKSILLENHSGKDLEKCRR